VHFVFFHYRNPSTLPIAQLRDGQNALGQLKQRRDAMQNRAQVRDGLAGQGETDSEGEGAEEAYVPDGGVASSDDELEELGEIEDGLISGRILKKPPPALAARHDVAFMPRACGTTSNNQIAAAFARLPPMRYFVLPAVTGKADAGYSMLTQEIYKTAEQALRLGRRVLAPISVVPGSWAALSMELTASGAPAFELATTEPLAMPNYAVAQDLIRTVTLRIKSLFRTGIEVGSCARKTQMNARALIATCEPSIHIFFVSCRVSLSRSW